MNHTPEQLKELDTLITAELELCDSTVTPQVCEMYENDSTATIELVRKYVLDKGIKIGEAIVEVERDFNPNVMED